jgi:outer membrane protein assembly factor BamB
MHRRTALTSCLAIALYAHAAACGPAVAPAAATDWPQFRGPGGQGVSQAIGVPVRWWATQNIAWKVPILGRGWSSPVLSAGRIYLTTAVEGDGGVGSGAAGGAGARPGAAGPSLRALCLDAADGKVLWDVEVFRPDAAAAAAMHSKNSPASATPVVTADRLYVHFGHMGTAALDPSGKVLWRQTSVTFPPVRGNGGSPVLVGGLLAFNCDGAKDPFVAALDAGSGEVRWKTPRETPAKSKFSFSTPLVIEVEGRTQLVSAASGFVGGYDPADGRELWRVRYGEGYSVVPRPVYSHGLLFVSSGFDSPVLYAIRPAGAAGDVTETHVAWKTRKGAPCTPSPVVVGDEVYFISDAGVATCADCESGAVHWTQRLDGSFSASPVSADGRVYFQNEAGVGYVVEAGRTFRLLAENDLGEPSLASYAAADGTLFIRTGGHLWRIRSREGGE